ncbi:MAG: RNA polymerase sigma factor [Planctomycetes bacterium]|nr:RNA polymerase sigma factor [Planctomycetota bacterium]
MRLVQLGGRQALSDLMRRHASSLLTFLRRMTGDHHRSEELFQDVFLAVWDQRQSYELSRSFRNWLFGIAANKCKSDVRSRQRRPVIPQGELVDNVELATASPHEAAVATETATIVDQALLQLPILQRQVVVLRVWNEMSYETIGRILGHSEATARSHMCHAVNSLRKHLEPRLHDSNS